MVCPISTGTCGLELSSVIHGPVVSDSSRIVEPQAGQCRASAVEAVTAAMVQRQLGQVSCMSLSPRKMRASRLHSRPRLHGGQARRVIVLQRTGGHMTS